MYDLSPKKDIPVQVEENGNTQNDSKFIAHFSLALIIYISIYSNSNIVIY